MARYTGFLQALLERSDERLSVGLSYQIADVTVPELIGVLEEASESIPDQPLRQLLGVFVQVMASTTRAPLTARIRYVFTYLI